MADTKSCYIIGPIGKPESKEREWADFVRDKIIEPAVVDCGYAKPSRADDPDTDVILMEIISQMFNADLVVADLTSHNGNVYYELGIRHCAQKAAIHLIQEEQKPLWDLGGNNAISIGKEPLIVEKAKGDIRLRIKAIDKSPDKFKSHVQMYMQLNELKLLKGSLKKVVVTNRILAGGVQS